MKLWVPKDGGLFSHPGILIDTPSKGRLWLFAGHSGYHPYRCRTDVAVWADGLVGQWCYDFVGLYELIPIGGSVAEEFAELLYEALSNSYPELAGTEFIPGRTL